MANHLYQGDLPDGLNLGPVVAIDCETMGLNPHRDRLCVVQLSGGDGDAHMIQIGQDQTEAPNLVAMLGDPDVLKLFQPKPQTIHTKTPKLYLLTETKI